MRPVRSSSSERIRLSGFAASAQIGTLDVGAARLPRTKAESGLRTVESEKLAKRSHGKQVAGTRFTGEFLLGKSEYSSGTGEPVTANCSPQIASVGLTEQAAREKEIDIRVGYFPFVGNGKAIAMGEDQGLVKVIFDKKTGQLLGAHMIGAEVTELIQGYVVAMNLKTTEQELMHTIFPHPTLSEMMKEAVLDACGRALNI